MILAYGPTALRRNVPHWLLGHRALIQFAGIVVLTIASLSLSAIVTERMREARLAVGQSRKVQLAIDRMVWDLLALQQPIQARRLDRDSDRASRFAGIRNNVRDDIVALIRQTADNPLQQQLLTEFDPLFRRYLSNVDRLAASEAGGGAARDLGSMLLADSEQMSLLIGEMRELEDILLKSRSERADLSFQLLLPTLLIAASFITLLVVMAAKSINRVVRERDNWLLEKEGELAAKDMMMREVDHRARNSLDLVYNLMTLQQQRPGHNDNSRNLLAEAANQILVVARVHDRLHKVRTSDRLPVGDSLRELCDDVAAYSLPKDQGALIGVRAMEAALPAEQSIWLGLIVVELVTNALKYGNPAAERPIQVDVARLDGQLRVTVSDRGRGLPQDFDPRTSKGLGMQVVGLLVKQLHGSLVIDRAWRGARFIVTMPLPADQDRVASATAPSVKTSAAIWTGPSGSRSARAEAT